MPHPTEPATTPPAPSPAGAPSPPLTSRPPLPVHAYYDSSRKSYLIQDMHSNWMAIDRHDVEVRLARLGVSNRRGDAMISPSDEVLLRIQHERNIYYAGPLAGFACGEHIINGAKILVTHEPVLVEPRAGDWPLLRALIDGLLGPAEAVPESADRAAEPAQPIDQTPIFHAWVKQVDEQLRSCYATGHVSYGQVLIFVGPKNSGKSLLQQIITRVTGGRVANPYGYMSGKTPFNRELFAAEHQMIEDEQPHKDYRNRVHFGEALKQIAASINRPCYGKNREAITLTPFWRSSVSINFEAIEVLPPVDDSLSDKLQILLCSKRPMPMAAGSGEEKRLFFAALLAELPAYLHWLRTEFVLDAALADPSRYGIKAFMHPAIMALLDDITPETRFLSLIDHILFQDGVLDWEGSSEELLRLLTTDDSYGAQVKSLVSAGASCGRFLTKLARTHPKRVLEGKRTAARRLWLVKRPVEEVTSPVGLAQIVTIALPEPEPAGVHII